MIGKPKALVRLDDTVLHLRNTLRKNKDKVPPSLAATICGFISSWGRVVHEGATAIAPGREKIAQWGGCADRQAGYNLATLRNWKFLEEVSDEQGGRGRKTVYSLNIVALIDALRLSGVKLHPTLVDKLSRIGEWAAKGSRKGSNGCSLSVAKPLTFMANKVADYTYISETARVTRTSLQVDRLEQDNSRGVRPQRPPPLDDDPVPNLNPEPQDLSLPVSGSLRHRPERSPARGSDTGEVVNLNDHRAIREGRPVPVVPPGRHDAAGPSREPSEAHEVGSNARSRRFMDRRGSRDE